jgi:predicted ATPase
LHRRRYPLIGARTTIPNGAGKSNFLDALRFLSEALSGPIDEAFENLGALSSVFDDPLGTGTLVILDSELSSSRAKMQPAPSRFVLSATLGTPKVLATRSSEKNAQ